MGIHKRKRTHEWDGRLIGLRVAISHSRADLTRIDFTSDNDGGPCARMGRAFTLIELLVVIAIIAVLIALSLPVARLARGLGHETVCRSNLHQMTVMLKTYCNDHDGLFPNPTYLYLSLIHISEPTRPY